jgi:azurin
MAITTRSLRVVRQRLISSNLKRITFAIESLKTGGDYSFFCTVMSHSVVMKGAFTISG